MSPPAPLLSAALLRSYSPPLLRRQLRSSLLLPSGRTPFLCSGSTRCGGGRISAAYQGLRPGGPPRWSMPGFHQKGGRNGRRELERRHGGRPCAVQPGRPEGGVDRGGPGAHPTPTASTTSLSCTMLSPPPIRHISSPAPCPHVGEFPFDREVECGVELWIG